MSIAHYLFDHDWLQRSDIEDLKQQAARLESRQRRDRELYERVEELEQDVGELALLCKTLMNLLLEHQVCTGKQLEDMMRQVDLEDGVADGKITKASSSQERKCPQCGHKVYAGKPNCMYCGFLLPVSGTESVG